MQQREFASLDAYSYKSITTFFAICGEKVLHWKSLCGNFAVCAEIYVFNHKQFVACAVGEKGLFCDDFSTYFRIHGRNVSSGSLPG